MLNHDIIEIKMNKKIEVGTRGEMRWRLGDGVLINDVYELIEIRKPFDRFDLPTFVFKIVPDVKTDVI